MTADLRSQLADYGQYLRDHQESIDLFEITEPNAVPLTAGIDDDFELDPASDLEIVITTREEEDSMNLKPSTLLLLAAAAVVVIAGIFFAVESGSDDSSPVISDEVPVSTTAAPQAIPATPQQIAEQFMDARDVWDAELVRALVADDVSIEDDGRVTSADGYAANIGFERASGWRFRDSACETIAVGPPVHVTCTYTMENAWSIALGVGPFTGSSFQFVIDDGQIGELSKTFDFSVFSNQVWEPVKLWVIETHPQDVDSMYDFSESVEYVQTTPEAIALWEKYTAEFVAETSAS